MASFKALRLSHIPEPAPNFSYTRTIGIESQFNLQWSRLWFNRYGDLSILLCLYYVTVILWLRIGMRNREAFILQRPLFLWNLFLATFSGVGALRTVPEMIEILGQQGGLHTSICLRRHYTVSSSFWVLLFSWSKALELLDTVFIVLRKKPLTFLHWYHHISVLCFCWKFYAEYPSTQRWFTVMNYVVHTIMYAYYALRALQIYIPRRFTIWITRVQIAQMMCGLYVTVYSYHIKRIGGYCHVSDLCLLMSFLMYFTYFVLFGQYFWKTYTAKSKTTTSTRGSTAHPKYLKSK